MTDRQVQLRSTFGAGVVSAPLGLAFTETDTLTVAEDVARAAVKAYPQSFTIVDDDRLEAPAAPAPDEEDA